MVRALRVCLQLDFCQTVFLTGMFFPSHCESFILKTLNAFIMHAFEEEVVGFLPSLAASEVGGEAGK